MLIVDRQRVGANLQEAVNALADVSACLVGTCGGGPYADVAALRALDATALDALGAHSVAYVATLRAWYLWCPTSAQAEDLVGYTVLAVTANGTNAGRWLRLDLAHPAWMRQTQWTVDPATGDNENLGTAAAPLRDDLERQRRMGPCPQWGAGGATAYDINLLGDLESFCFAGEPAGEATSLVSVRVHGNASTGLVTGPGKSQLFAGGGSDAVVPMSQATDQPYTLVGSALGAGGNPANWTALRYRRVRWTSGPALGATQFVAKDLGSKTAQLTNTMAANFDTSVAPVPVTGNTYVVEDLVQVRLFTLTARSRGRGLALYVDGITSGKRDAVYGVTTWTSPVYQSWTGCEVWNPGGSGTLSDALVSPVWLGCWFNSQATFIDMPATGVTELRAGGAAKTMQFFGSYYFNSNSGAATSQTFRGAFMIVDGHLAVMSGMCRIVDLAVFDAPFGRAVHVQHNAHVVLGAGAGWSVWGNPATSTFIMNPGTVVTEDGQSFNVHEGSSGMIQMGSRTAVERFDTATRAYLATATMTKANYASAGVFNRRIVDPVTGISFQAG